MAKAGFEPDNAFATKPQPARAQAEQALEAGHGPRRHPGARLSDVETPSTKFDPLYGRERWREQPIPHLSKCTKFKSERPGNIDEVNSIRKLSLARGG